MMERYFSRKGRFRTLTIVLLAVSFLSGASPLAAQWDAASATASHKVISPVHISPERARALLTELGIGTVSRMPATNALLITGAPSDLQKAVSILGVVDVPGGFEIAELGPASSARTLPSHDRIAAAVGNISIGTFAHPPRAGSEAKALIDIHNGAVIAIAPVFQLQDIKLAVELGPEALRQRRTAARPSSSAVVAQAVQTARPELERPTDAQYAERLTGPPPTTRPVPASPFESRPASADLSFGQTRGTTAGSDSTEGFETILEKAQADPDPLGLPDPNRAEPTALEPGQVVPSEVEPVVELKVEPELVAPAADTPAQPEPIVAEVETPAQAELAAASTPGVLSYEPGDFPNGEHVVDMALPPEMPVIQLLDLVGKYLNLSYVYDPQKVQGNVTLKLNGNLKGSMKVKDLYLMLESVLQFKNLVMTRHKGNIVKIVPITEILNADPELVTSDTLAVEAGDVVVTRVFELEHIDTKSAENFLTGLGLTSGGVTSIAESKTLIVTAYAHRMGRIERLLKMVDKPGEPRKFRYRQLKYTMAKTLADKVKVLAEQLESVTVTVGEPDTAAATTKLPGESDAAYRARLARARATAAARARTQAAQRATGTEEAKPGVYLDADERTNRILMIGVEKQLGLVEELIDSLDVEQQDLRAMKLYRIKHVDAEEVAKKLQELGIISRLPDMAATSSSRLTGAARTPTDAAAAARARAARTPTTPAEATATAEVTEEGLVEEPQVVVVESTNSLLVNATAEQHAQIEKIIGFVDTEMDEDEIPYKIYPLENSGPSHLAEVLESLIQETVEDPEGKIEKVIKKEEEITIVPDPNTYSLIVYASKKNQEWISNLIEQLDKRRPQVLIDVTLVEITEEDKFTYDLNMIWSRRGGDNVSVAIPEELPITNTVDTVLQTASGGFAFYGDRHIQALLTAVQSKNYGRVLAKPKLLVNDNEPGMIKTTDTTYVEVTSSIPVTSGGAGTQENLIQTSKDFTPYEAGIMLDITPHISEGDLLRLDIQLTRSDFLPTEDQERPPNTTASEVGTAVTVPDGSTIILGGLLKLNQNKGGKKVPLLGDIPILGGLFRGVNNSDKQSKLYVFVKAEIIRPAEQGDHGMAGLEAISERNRIAFEKHESKFQNYQDWPGIRPRPVDPAKVLEAQ